MAAKHTNSIENSWTSGWSDPKVSYTISYFYDGDFMISRQGWKTVCPPLPLKQVIRLLQEQNKRLSSHGLARSSLASFLVWDRLQMLLVYFLVFQCYVNWTVTRSWNREHLVVRTPQRLSHIMQNLLLFSRLFSHCFRLFLLVSLLGVWDSLIL